MARYSGSTRSGYACDLRAWFAWCAKGNLDVFAVRRVHIELYACWTEEDRHLARTTIGRRLSTVVGFYRFAVVDGYMAESPAQHVRRPKIETESTTLGLDRMELAAFLAQAAAAGPVDHALARLLGLLGLRVSEACGIDIEHLGTERGHRTVTVLGKGAKAAVIPLPPRVARSVDLAAGERLGGPVLLSRSGRRLDRHGATHIVRRVARRAGIVKHISPHSLRHSFITAASTLACRFATCRLPPATPIPGRRPATTGPDRRASYIVTAFAAGGAQQRPTDLALLRPAALVRRQARYRAPRPPGNDAGYQASRQRPVIGALRDGRRDDVEPPDLHAAMDQAIAGRFDEELVDGGPLLKPPGGSTLQGTQPTSAIDQSQRSWGLAADAVVAVHAVFIAFLLSGGFLTWWWPGAAAVHVMALVASAAIYLGGL